MKNSITRKNSPKHTQNLRFLMPTVAVWYSYKASFARPTFDIRALWRLPLSSECPDVINYNDGLTRSGKGCFIAVPYGNSGRQRVNGKTPGLAASPVASVVLLVSGTSDGGSVAAAEEADILISSRRDESVATSAASAWLTRLCDGTRSGNWRPTTVSVNSKPKWRLW